jgi:serine/threonine-protein kinase
VKLVGIFCALTALALAATRFSPSSSAGTPAKDKDLPGEAKAILEKHCVNCHGPKKQTKGLNLIDYKHLLDAKRRVVVPGKPAESKLIKRIRTDDEVEQMPPNRPKLSEEDAKVLENWIISGARDFTGATAAPPRGGAGDGKPALPPEQEKAELAAKVKELFRTRCNECHGNGASAGDLEVNERASLLKESRVVPNNPDKSTVFLRITGKKRPIMPEEPREMLSADEQDLVRRWILVGAPKFPDGPRKPRDDEHEDEGTKGKHIKGVDHVLAAIKDHVMKRKVKPNGLRDVRYFSINHLLVAGANRSRLETERQALIKAINHLSREATLFIPEAIDEHKTVYAVDLTKLGWDHRPYKEWENDKAVRKSPLNLFDLALLEYPYGVAFSDRETMDWLMKYYVKPSGMARPIPYVRADWFVSIATQPPLYNDFLLLPRTVEKLEEDLGVNAAHNIEKFKARRGAVVKSGVSRNNRVVERHPISRDRYYWKSYDFRTSKGPENIFRDPIDLKQAGGEMIFSLPNGLQGYFVTDGRGNRQDSAPTEVVVDKFATDKVVHNGLSCMRCHERGMIKFQDVMRPALKNLVDDAPLFDKDNAKELYADAKEMGQLLQDDEVLFTRAMEALLGKLPRSEPIAEVTKNYEYPINVLQAADELGYEEVDYLAKTLRYGRLTPLGLMPLGGGEKRNARSGDRWKGLIARDAWEDYFPLVVRVMGLGKPIIPLDGLQRRDFPGSLARDIRFSTNKKGNIVKAGDELFLYVENKGGKAVYIEIVAADSQGTMQVVTTGDKVEPGKRYQYPPRGEKGIPVLPGRDKEPYSLYASTTKFRGRLLRSEGRVGDRVYHPSFYEIDKDSGKLKAPPDVMKKTIEIENQ